MKPDVKATDDSAVTIASLRQELARYKQELGARQQRVEQLEGFYTHVADAVFIVEADGQIVDANPAACDLLGYSMTELLALHPWDFVTSANREEILALMRNLQPRIPVTVQRTYRTKAGTQKAMDLRMVRSNLAGRDLIIVSCRDVTEQRRLEDRLRQSEKNLAEGQRLTKTGSWILDFKTGNTNWSVETCRIFGFPDPPPSPHYSEFRARVRPEDRDAVDRGLRESFETGEPRPLKYIFILPDGTRKNIETISQPVRDEAGTVVRLMGTVMDVTERVKAEEALRRSKDHLRLVIDTIPGLVWSAGTDGYIEYLNQRWIDFTGLTLEQAGGWGWQTAVCPADLPGLLEYWKSILATGQPGETEARLRRNDGTYRWFLFRGVPLHDDSGKLVQWYGTNTDIEDRKRAEALIAGEKRLLEMIANGDPLKPILDALCRLGEEICDDASVSILLVSPDGKQLRHGAAPSLPATYTSAIDGGLIGPSAASCGTAAYRGETVIVSDIGSDPLWMSYRDVAMGHGLRACWSTPIFSGARRVIGTFALYARSPGQPTAQHRSVIDQLSQLTSIAIERTRAQETLSRSEAYLAQAQKLSRTGSFGWNIVTGELAWSDETCCILGYERTVKPELERVLDRVHPDDRTMVHQMLERATRTVTDLDFAHRLLLPDGVVKYVHVMARATRSKEGAAEFVGAVMDITEQQRTQENMLAARARFEGILEIAEDAIISVDSRQRIVLFNQGAEKVFGYAQREIIGEPLERLLPIRFKAAHQNHLAEFAAAADVARAMGQRREVFGRRRDGCEFPAEASISKLDLGGELVFTVILRDITERKQVAEALRASEKFARGQAEALTAALDALARESSPDRIVEHVLHTITGQLGAHSSSVWLRDETSGLMVFEFALEHDHFKTKVDAKIAAVSPSLRIADVWPWPEVFRTGKPYVLADIREGPEFPWRQHVLSLGVVTILVVPMLISGQVEGVIGIRFTSVRTFRTEELELAQALANQAMLALQLMRLSFRSRQSAVIAERNRMARDIHDTLAQGFTGVIVQLEAAADATAKGLTPEARAHLERAADLARESLREARRSVQALRPQALEEKPLCEALGDLIQKLTVSTGLRAEFSVLGAPRQLPPAWEDNLLRIGQEVLTNALRHAKASEFKAQVVFNSQSLRLELRDNGCGFHPASKHDGFGLLGMRERVEAMGGQLSLESAPGAGTAILIALPLMDNLSPSES